ncbi:hypothetical protein TKK_0009216 [Trichogramma kaykai]
MIVLLLCCCVAGLLLQAPDNVEAQFVRSRLFCPAKCTCLVEDTLRCVFQRLAIVPSVPADTSVLDLRFNNLTVLRSSDFSHLKHLHTLLLNDNQIEHLPAHVFSGATNLRFLYLYNNRLRSLDPRAFSNLLQLEQLYLQSNGLKIIKPATFGDLSQLRTLFLQDNKIERIAATAFRNVASIARLRLEGNALVCDCELLWLLEKAKDGSEVSAECQEPRHLRDRKLSDATPTDFQCKKRPVIMEEPEDVQVTPGDRAVFRCRAVGDPQPRVKWMRDSNELAIDGYRYNQQADGSLIVSEVDESDSGHYYECLASNDMGQARSRRARALVVNVALPTPRIAEAPASQTVLIGSDAQLVCRVDGPSARTLVEWFFSNGTRVQASSRIRLESNGSVLKILGVQATDAARYVCRARNGRGLAETSADLRVVDSSLNSSEPSSPPVLLVEPQDMEVELGSMIELACRATGKPQPTITWRRDGTIVQGNGVRLSKHGSLYLYNVTGRDSGRYECSAANDEGRASATALLRVRQPAVVSEGLVFRAFVEAQHEIDRAVNNTLRELFEPSSSTSSGRSNPFRLSRFPDVVARKAARPAELFERALTHIRRMVDSGARANATDDFHYQELLSPRQLVQLERLSGCTAHRRADKCSNVCFHNRYRSFDGRCNNLENPTWGASYTGFRRLLKPVYENGFSQPVGWDSDRLYHGFPKPAARLVSTELISTEPTTEDAQITHMVMQWGQWLDHDLDHALPAVSSESWGGIDCKKTCDNAAPCFPMQVPPNDPRIKNRRCIDFFRTSAVCGSGMTSILWGKLTPREQLNQLTSYLDASQVYGYDDETARELRDFGSNLGLLREGPGFRNAKPMLPYANGQFIDCRRNLSESNVNCFLAGDFRVNEQVGLTAMHTVWMREHNRLARALKLMNPQWNGEKLYQEARKIVAAQMQVITYRDWIPLILGSDTDELFGEYRSYKADVDASISNVFATAALRFGHSLIQPKFERLTPELESIPEGPLHLRDAFFAPWRLVDEGGTDPLLRGMFATPAKLKKPTENLNSELTEQLFRIAHAVALDLAAMNIQRGRDHAIPFYLDWRAYCNMSHVETFDDLAGEISSAEVREKLRRLYGDPRNIDVWVGGILEDQLPDAKVGPLFKCLLAEQFQRTRDGDRFWYENPGVFSTGQLEQIRKSSLARVLCDNGDNITRIQRNVFLLPGGRDNDFRSCDEVPSIDLKLWYECCEECAEQVETNDVAITRSRRAADKYLAHNNYDDSELKSSDRESARIEEMLIDANQEYKKINKVLLELRGRINEMEQLLEQVRSKERTIFN